MPLGSAGAKLMAGSTIVKLKLFAVEAPTESTAVTVRVKAPTTVGTPVILAPLKLNPLGSPLTVMVYGATPQAAATGALYATPAVPFGSAVVEMVTDGFTVRFVRMQPAESATPL